MTPLLNYEMTGSNPEYERKQNAAHRDTSTMQHRATLIFSSETAVLQKLQEKFRCMKIVNYRPSSLTKSQQYNMQCVGFYWAPICHGWTLQWNIRDRHTSCIFLHTVVWPWASALAESQEVLWTFLLLFAIWEDQCWKESSGVAVQGPLRISDIVRKLSLTSYAVGSSIWWTILTTEINFRHLNLSLLWFVCWIFQKPDKHKKIRAILDKRMITFSDAKNYRW